jgi:hypothetical protein
MNIAEAMQALLDGKKIRSVKWSPDVFYSLENFGEIGETDIKQEFEIYEEPKSECEFVIDHENFYKNATEIAKCTKHAKDDPNCELNKNSKPEPKFKEEEIVKCDATGLLRKILTVNWDADLKDYVYDFYNYKYSILESFLSKYEHKFTREIKCIPAYDFTSINRGIHNAELIFIVKCEAGALTLTVDTGWYLDRKLKMPIDCPQGSYVGWHRYEGDENELTRDSCQYLDGKKCYGDGSFCDSRDFGFILVEKGSDAVFEKMEEYFLDRLKKEALELRDFFEEPKPEHKFNIGDKVLSLGGYYKGEKGEIISINKSGKYEVKFNASNMPCMPVTMLEKNLEKVEEEQSDIPPMKQKEISKEEFKKKYPDVEKEEWTYPCVAMHKDDPRVIYIAISNDKRDEGFASILSEADGSSDRYIIKKFYKVIATDLRNLDL